MIWIVLLASAVGTVSASRNLHNKLLDNILHAPMSFFDTTPLGRILNRFSRDLDVIDSNIPVFLRTWLFSIAPLLSTIVIIIYSSPIFLAVLIPMGGVYYLIQVRHSRRPLAAKTQDAEHLAEGPAPSLDTANAWECSHSSQATTSQVVHLSAHAPCANGALIRHRFQTFSCSDLEALLRQKSDQSFRISF